MNLPLFIALIVMGGIPLGFIVYRLYRRRKNYFSICQKKAEKVEVLDFSSAFIPDPFNNSAGF